MDVVDSLGAMADLTHMCWDVAIPAEQLQTGSQGDFCGTARFHPVLQYRKGGSA